MSKDAIAATLEKLRSEIRRHDDLYYLHARPEITDTAYDALITRLIALESEHPELVTVDSPSQRVGGRPIEGFASVHHRVRMMSVDNTYEEAGVREFDDRVRRLLGTGDYSYTCEPKIDGVSLALRYEGESLDHLVLTVAATRGDGVTGDDVTVNARTLRNVPLRLRSPGIASGRDPRPNREEEAGGSLIIEVRGEAFLSRAQFARINAAQDEAGEEPYANPRNTAAGTLKQLDPKIVASRKLEFLPHGAGELRGIAVETFTQWQQTLRDMGFRTSDHFERCADVEAVLVYIRKFAEVRHSLPYDTDGVVVKLDRFEQRAELGETAKSPRWCVAYKYPPEQAETELARVTFHVGKTGTITPVAEFEPPVFISGTNVYRASLHNFDEIARKDIHLHDRVLVEKAGEVIPYVVGPVAAKRPAHARAVERPRECPSCGSRDLEHDGGFVRCTNPDCPAQLAQRLRFWSGRNQMDIAEIGPAVIDALLKAGAIGSIGDLYRLRLEDVRDLVVSEYERTEDEKPGLLADDAGEEDEEAGGKRVRVTIGAKRGGNIIAGILASKERGLARVLAGLGILHIGTRTAQLVARHFQSLEKLQRAPLAEILAAPEMGGGMLKDIDKLRERYPETAALSVEQILGVAEIEGHVQNALQAARARRGHEKSPRALIEQLRGRGVAARSLFSFLHSDKGRAILADLTALGLKMTEAAPRVEGPQPLAGLTIVVTGTLAHFSRGEIKKKIESLGGKTSESVSKSTAFVVAGEEAGSKLAKAEKLGVAVLDEAAFLRRIGEEGGMGREGL